MARPSLRPQIVSAAEDVVLEIGAGRLTLDAVAERAGISKGGLLYHFPTKESLLSAMLVGNLEVYRTRLLAALEELPPGNGKLLRAHLMALLTKDERSRQVAAALLAAVASDPKLMVPVLARNQEIFQELACGTCTFKAETAILCLAADGIIFQELLGISPLTPEQRQEVFSELLRRAEVEDNWDSRSN